MSAFMVDNDLIDLLVSAATPLGAERLGWYHGGVWHYGIDPTEVGQMMLAENRRSVDYLYDEREPIPDYAFRRVDGIGEAIPWGQVALAIECFDYQACETPDWKESEAYAFCVALKDRLLQCLPGYGDALWGWSRAGQAELNAERAGATG